MARRWIHNLKIAVKLSAVFYILFQTLSLLYEIIYTNPTILSMIVEKEPNQKVRHPLYTFCPILNVSANVNANECTLYSVMVANGLKMQYVFYMPFINSIANAPRTFSTWLKTHSIDKQGKVQLIHCITFEFEDEIVPGQEGGKVTLSLNSLRPENVDRGLHVKEFHVFIHKEPGYLNSFMLANGKPQIILPGYDLSLGAQKPQIFHYIIRQTRLERNENCHSNQSDYCVEEYLQARLGSSCRLPWKSSEESVCPSCDWLLTGTGCRANDFVPHMESIHSCHVDIGSMSCLGDAMFDENDCLACDPGCVAFEKDELCHSKGHLETVMKHLPLPWMIHDFSRVSGCLKPCSTYEFEVIEIQVTSTMAKIFPNWDPTGLLTLELATDEIQTVSETPAYSIQFLLNDFAGNVGMLLGTSLFGLLPFKQIQETRPKQMVEEVSQSTLLGISLILISLNYDKFRENKIIMHEMKIGQSEESDEEDSSFLQPLMTICPTYSDYAYLPAKGYPKTELNFLKFSILMNKNFLLKQFPYKGKWSTKWFFSENNYLSFMINGQKCYTYRTSDLEKHQAVLELNRHEVESFKVYLHEFDNIEDAFMHRTSGPKINIPFYNQRFGLQPNVFHYKLKANLFEDKVDVDCDDDLDYQPQEKCFSQHLEDTLGCKVPFHEHTTDLESCNKCQLPFTYNNKTYSQCTDADASQPWCPVATYLNGDLVTNAWEFCQGDCKSGDNIKSSNMCTSKDDLHKYLQLFHDKSNTNPQIIAERLYSISCPFRCDYKEYASQLVYKKHEVSLGEDKVRLVLEFDAKTDVSNFVRDLLYTTDMFVSDIGSIFGPLLGLSLFDLISGIFSSGIGLASAIKKKKNHQQEKPEQKQLWLHAYHVLKWLVTLCIVISLIYLSQNFDPILQSIFASEEGKAKEITDVMQLDESKDNIGFFKGGIGANEDKASCPNPDDKGDGYCDERSNDLQCDYDGDDCCNSRKNIMPNGHLFCSNCSCHDKEKIDNRQIKSGLCQFCVFPFLPMHDRGLFGMKDDCTLGEQWKEYFCPVAVDKVTSNSLGFPYEIGCPEKEEGEQRPTCFVSLKSQELDHIGTTTPQQSMTVAREFLHGKLCTAGQSGKGDEFGELKCQGCYASGPSECEQKCFKDMFCYAWSYNTAGFACWLDVSDQCIEQASGWVYGFEDKAEAPSPISNRGSLDEMLLLVVGGQPREVAYRTELFEFVRVPLAEDFGCDIGGSFSSLFLDNNNNSSRMIVNVILQNGTLPISCGVDTCHSYNDRLGAWTLVPGLRLTKRSNSRSVLLDNDGRAALIAGEPSLSTDIVSFTDADDLSLRVEPGPDLSTPGLLTCMLRLNSTLAIAVIKSVDKDAMLFGYDIVNAAWSLLPIIQHMRTSIVDCGIIRNDEDGGALYAVFLGLNKDNDSIKQPSIQLWDFSFRNRWIAGPDVPMELVSGLDHGGAERLILITRPDKAGLLLIPPLSSKTMSNNILELVCKHKNGLCHWIKHDEASLKVANDNNSTNDSLIGGHQAYFVSGQTIHCKESPLQDRLVILMGEKGIRIFGQGQLEPQKMTDTEHEAAAAAFDFSRNGNFGQAGLMFGGTLPVICTGFHSQIMCMHHLRSHKKNGGEWKFIESSAGKVFPEIRHFFSGLVIGDNCQTLFLVGGDASVKVTDSTEFVTFSKDNTTANLVYLDTQPGPSLPQTRTHACFVKINATHAVLAGGYYNNSFLDVLPHLTDVVTTSYIYSIPGQSWSLGPEYIYGKSQPNECAVVQDLNPTYGSYVVKPGGNNEPGRSVTEILVLGERLEWIPGPDLPGGDLFGFSSRMSMATTPDRTGALVIGGRYWVIALSEEELGHFDLHKTIAMIRCREAVCSWTIIGSELTFNRMLPYTFLLPRQLIDGVSKKGEAFATENSGDVSSQKPYKENSDEFEANGATSARPLWKDSFLWLSFWLYVIRVLYIVCDLKYLH